MKKLFTYGTAALCFFLYSCNPTMIRKLSETDGKLMGVLPMKNGKVTYSLVRSLPGKSDHEIFRQSRRWMAFLIDDPKEAFQASDFQTKDIVGTGEIPYLTISPKNGPIYITPKVSYSFSIEANNGEYRATISNFKLDEGFTANAKKYPIESGTYRSSNQEVIEHFKLIDNRARLLLQSLNTFLEENTRSNQTADR